MFLLTLVLPLQDPIYAFSVLLVILLLAPIIAKPLKLPALIVLIVLGCLLGSNGLGIIARDPLWELLLLDWLSIVRFQWIAI